MTAADTSRRFLRTPVQDLCPHADDKLEKLEESFHTAGLCEGDSSIIHQPLLEGSSPFMRTTDRYLDRGSVYRPDYWMINSYTLDQSPSECMAAVCLLGSWVSLWIPQVCLPRSPPLRFAPRGLARIGGTPILVSGPHRSGPTRGFTDSPWVTYLDEGREVDESYKRPLNSTRRSMVEVTSFT